VSSETLDGLLEKLSAGDRAAAERIVAEYGPYLRLVVRRHLSPFLRTQLDSVDLVQSVWLQVLQGLGHADWQFGSPEELRAFLVKTLRHRLIDHARRMKAGQRREQQAAAQKHSQPPRPSETVRAGELWERMLDLCPPQHRPILQYKRQGLGLSEIAARTGLHPSSVRRVLYDLAGRLALQAAD
jgi:RNA polymerase sigma-70 factor (ECF subfamily)